MARSLLDQIIPANWDSQKPTLNSGAPRVRYLQQLDDLVNRPVKNRLSALTNATAINCIGSAQSSGVGVGPMQPRRYAEFTVKARVTFNINSTGPVYLYVYRSTIGVPAAGAPEHGGDVLVGGDAFFGGAVLNGSNTAASFSFLDSGLQNSKNYWYYIAVVGPNGTTLNVINSSQLLVMERS